MSLTDCFIRLETCVDTYELEFGNENIEWATRYQTELLEM
jgi:hypothetical protein